MIAYVVFHKLGICDFFSFYFFYLYNIVVALVFVILKSCMVNSIFIWNFAQMGFLVFEEGSGMCYIFIEFCHHY